MRGLCVWRAPCLRVCPAWLRHHRSRSSRSHLTAMRDTHPLIAREGWPHVLIALALALLATWLVGWWSIPFWLLLVFVVQFFRDPQRAIPQTPGRRAVACRRPRGAGRQGARSLPRARCAQDQRVHERVQRPLQPQPGGRGGRKDAGTTRAASSTPRWTRRRSRTSALALASAHGRRRRRDLRAGRRPGRAPHPVLCERRATASRAASATVSSASARASTSTCRPTATPQVSVGDTVTPVVSVIASLQGS